MYINICIYKIFNKINNLLIRVFINIIYIYFLLYHITLFEDKILFN